MMAFRQFKEGQQRNAQFQKSLECEEEGRVFSPATSLSSYEGT